ncbi:unnamed protein product, partial [Trichogramma brassicae]
MLEYHTAVATWSERNRREPDYTYSMRKCNGNSSDSGSCSTSSTSKKMRPYKAGKIAKSTKGSSTSSTVFTERFESTKKYKHNNHSSRRPRNSPRRLQIASLSARSECKLELSCRRTHEKFLKLFHFKFTCVLNKSGRLTRRFEKRCDGNACASTALPEVLALHEPCTKKLYASTTISPARPLRALTCSGAVMDTSRCPVEGHYHSWSKVEDKNLVDRLDRSHSHMHVFWSRRAEQGLFGEGKSLDCVLRRRQALLSPALANRLLAVMASVDESQVAADVDIFPKYLKSQRRWRHHHGDKQETWWPMDLEPIYFELLMHLENYSENSTLKEKLQMWAMNNIFTLRNSVISELLHLLHVQVKEKLPLRAETLLKTKKCSNTVIIVPTAKENHEQGVKRLKKSFETANIISTDNDEDGAENIAVDPPQIIIDESSLAGFFAGLEADANSVQKVPLDG